MTDELKPCPFCGGEAELFESNISRSVEYSVYIGCPTCGGQTTTTSAVPATQYTVDSTRQTVISRWNRRVSDGE